MPWRITKIREEILRQYFEGKISASELLKDLEASTEKLSSVVSDVHIEDMEHVFGVQPSMLIRLCNDVLNGELPAWCLEVIGFALIASDKFEWDGDEHEVMANVIADWSCPEINYPLTLGNVQRFHAWLTKIEKYPEKPPLTGQTDRLVSMKFKRT